MGSNGKDNFSIQSVAKKSVYAPRQPVRKAPWETAQAALRDSAAQSTSKPPVKRAYPPAKKANTEARARRARAREEDKRRLEVLKLDSDSFKIPKYETASGTVHANVIFDRELVHGRKGKNLTPAQDDFISKKQQIYISHHGSPFTQEVSIYNCQSTIGITIQSYRIEKRGARGSR